MPLSQQCKPKGISQAIHSTCLWLCCTSPGPVRLCCARVWISGMTKTCEHLADGWYLGVASKHYRCHKISFKKMQAERISDTVFFKHKYIMKPEVVPADAIIKALYDLKPAISKQWKHSSNAMLEGLQQIDEALTWATTTTQTQGLTQTPNRSLWGTPSSKDGLQWGPLSSHGSISNGGHTTDWQRGDIDFCITHEVCCHVTTHKTSTQYMMGQQLEPEHVLLHHHHLLTTPEPTKQPVLSPRRKC